MSRGTIGENSLLKTVTRQCRGCDSNPGRSVPESSTLAKRLSVCLSVRLSVPWRSCPRRAAALGYMHAGCLQLSHCRPPEMCVLRIRPRTDVDPPRVELPSVKGISSRRPRGDNLSMTPCIDNATVVFRMHAGDNC